MEERFITAKTDRSEEGRFFFVVCLFLFLALSITYDITFFLQVDCATSLTPEEDR